MAEIIVVHGPPGAGKSTHSRQLVTEGFEDYDTVQHISVGDRRRAIKQGVVASVFSDYLTDPEAPSPLPDEVVNGLVFEALHKAAGRTLGLIDGFPSKIGGIGPFLRTISLNDHKLLGAVAMETSLQTSIDRVSARGVRDGENIEASDLKDRTEHRYNRYKTETVQTLEALEQLGIPVIRIGASGEQEAVYGRFTSAIGALAIRNTKLQHEDKLVF